MDRTVKTQIKSYILDYLKLRIPDFKITGKMFPCPFKEHHKEQTKKPTANIFPPNSYKVHCYDPNCGKLGDIFDICRKLDFNGQDLTDEDIVSYLKQELNIKTNDDTEKLLAQYYNWGWDLVPIGQNGKIPIEKNWTNKNHKVVAEWKQWLDSKLNIGVKTGAISQTTIIDFDLIPKVLKDKIYNNTATKAEFKEAQEIREQNLQKLKQLTCLEWNTVKQETFGGIHLCFQYDSDIAKSFFDWEGIHIDVQNDGGYILIEPSITGNQKREIVGEEILSMNWECKEWILNHTKKRKLSEVKIDNNEASLEKIQGLEGCCNQTFVKVGGMFRKKMNPEQVEYALSIVNKYMLDDPMEHKAIRAMSHQIEKYHEVDVDEIGKKILDHLQIVEVAHIKDIRECLGFDRKDLETAIRFLVDHKKVYKVKKDLYKLIQDIEWQEDFLSLGKPLDFKIPYFEDYAHFESGNLIVIGAVSGSGKTHLAVNFIKKFVEQGKYVHLITTEAGSKFQKVAQVAGLKEGDFGFFKTNDPCSVPFKKDAITIIDWLKPPNSDYAKTDTLYEHLNDKLVEKGGLLIVFAQLKRKSLDFYAEDMIEFYSSLVAKFLYPKNGESYDNLNPYFQTTKIRDSKVNKQYIDIPLKFNLETKIVELKK